MDAKTSWWQDIKYIARVRSFMLNVVGFTCVTFMVGALAWWAPVYLEKAVVVYEEGNCTLSLASTSHCVSPVAKNRVNSVLGIILGVSGGFTKDCHI